MSGNKVESDIFWDGKFPDAVKAKPGEYFITLKISDAAGNERMMTTRVSVTLLNSLIPLPAFEPPTSAPEPEITPQAESTPSTFGGETGVAITPSAPFTSTIGGDHTTEEKPVTTQTVSKAPVTSSFPVPASAVLWGAASAAAVGFFVSEAQKRKQEEEQKRREAAEAQQNALAQMFLNDTKPEPTETQEFASSGNDLGAYYADFVESPNPVFAPITAAPITGGGSKPVLTYASIPFSEMMDACPKLKLAVRAANLAISASNAANTAYSNARYAADSARAEVTQAEDMTKQYAARVLELGKLAAGALKDAVKYSFDQGAAWSKLQVLKGELWAAQKAEDAAYWVYDKAKNAPWWVPLRNQIRDAAWWVYDKARKAREALERQVQNQQKRYDQISAMAAAARRAAADLTASAAKAAASAAYWGGQVALRRIKSAALELAARAAKLAANVAIGAKEAAERLVASQRVDCQKTLAERQRLESLANQLAALTGVSAATWLKPGTFTGPFDKAANLQNLIAAIGIWNALKAKPAEALNAIKTGLPNLWNSITNAFKNNPLAAWGTAIGTTIVALLGGYTAICGLSSTLSMLHLAGFVFLPLTGGLTTNKKQKVYGIVVGMLMLGMILSACGGGASSAPEIPACATAPSTNTPTPTPTQTMTPPPPTATAIPFVLPGTTRVLQPSDVCSTIAVKYGITIDEFVAANNNDNNTENDIYYVPDNDPSKTVCFVTTGVEYVIPP